MANNNGRGFSRERPRPPHNQRGQRRQKLFIAVMGEQGAGKSALIRRLTRRHDVQVDHTIGGTRNKPIRTYNAYLPSPSNHVRYEVKFIDCPGFESADLRPDGATIDDILAWLRDTYGYEKKLHGVIYMVSINITRFTAFSARNIAMFRELIGEHFYKNVVLATTFWEELPGGEKEGIEREHEMMSRPAIFLSLVRGGAKVCRIHSDDSDARYNPVQSGPYNSDLAIVWEIARNHPDWLLAQHEFAAGIPLSQTSAHQTHQAWTRYYAQGEYLDSELEQDRRGSEKEIARHESRLKHNRKEAEDRMREEISDEQAAKVADDIAAQDQEAKKERLEAQIRAREGRSPFPDIVREIEETKARNRRKAEDLDGYPSDDGKTTASSNTSRTTRGSGKTKQMYYDRKITPSGRGPKTVKVVYR